MANQSLQVPAPSSVSDLDNLAKEIDAAHLEVGAALLTSVQRAAEVGHLLAQAKEQVPFGQWEAWVTENTVVSPRTARGYMQAARYWMEADKAKRRALADLGLQGLLTEIAKPRCIPAHELPAGGKVDAHPMKVRFSVEEVGRSTKIKTTTNEVPSEDPERAGGPEQDRLAATMKSVREAEEESAAPRESRFNKSDRLEFRRSLNLDAAKQAYLRLDKADRQEFRNWAAEGATAPAPEIIIDATT